MGAVKFAGLKVKLCFRTVLPRIFTPKLRHQETEKEIVLAIRCKSYFFRNKTFFVMKILKGSLDSIPSPSPLVQIQIMGGKVCLRHKGQTLL